MPEIKKESGVTSIDVILVLKPGFACRTVTALFLECQKFLDEAKAADGKARMAYLIPDDANYPLRFTSCLDLLSFAGVPGKKGTIQVDGEDKTAEKIALRLYSALTSEDAYNPDFYRFERQ